jgi:alpha-ketoglutaric semialdehyde dehydrogenase
VAGIYLHGCVRSTVLDAYERGFTVWVADDATGSTEPEHAAQTRNWLRSRAARFLSVAEALARLDAARAA